MFKNFAVNIFFELKMWFKLNRTGSFTWYNFNCEMFSLTLVWNISTFLSQAIQFLGFTDTFVLCFSTNLKCSYHFCNAPMNGSNFLRCLWRESSFLTTSYIKACSRNVQKITSYSFSLILSLSYCLFKLARYALK